MAATPYSIAEAFERIENTLLDSMMRNFKRHRAEETAEGYNWTAWQAEQLKALNEYKKRNRAVFPKQFAEINQKIDELIDTTAKDGEASAEAEILKAIRKGAKISHKPTQGIQGEFFKLNDRKLDALIKATHSDFVKAEHAILRRADDIYRKAIFNAQAYANTGAGTYAQAVDMAVRDMMRAGLDCVEYKNGARHTLSNYAEMAIRTANKRANLMGEGNKRAEWGIHTVVVNHRYGACALCAPFVGKIFIDDVYSGGKKGDGNYPLLSNAIREGLFHPNCKDGCSTWFEGISRIKPVTPEEEEEMNRREKLAARQNYYENQAEKCERIAEHSLDKDNKRTYERRAKINKQNAEKIAKSLEKSTPSGIIKAEDYQSVTECKNISEARRYFSAKWNVELDKSIDELDFVSVKESLQGIESVLNEFPKAVDSLKRIGTSTKYGIMNADYDGNINFNPFYFKERKKAVYGCKSETHYHPTGNNVMSTGAHECGHILEKALIDKGLGGEQPIGNVFWNSGEQAKRIVKQAVKNTKKLPECKGIRRRELIKEISGYAWDKGDSECLAEAIADYILNGEKAAPLSKEIWKLLKKELI